MKEKMMKKNISPRKRFHIWGILALAAVGMVVASCDDKEYTTNMPESQFVTDIQLKVSETLPVQVGTDTTIVYQVLPENASRKDLKWSSNNELVATVSEDGTIHGVGVGETTINVVPSLGFGQAGSTSRSITVKVIPEVIKMQSIEFTNTEHELYENAKMQLEYNILPADHTYSYLTWETSDPAVATVDENGMVYSHAVGDVTIYAIAHDKSNVRGEFHLKVKKEVPAEDVAILPYRDMLFMGQKLQIQTQLTPTDASPSSLTWASSNTKVLTVSDDGVVTAVGWGSATITATCKNTEKSARITLTVNQGNYLWNGEYGFGTWYTNTSGASTDIREGKLVVTLNNKRRADLMAYYSTSMNGFYMNFTNYPVIAMKCHIAPKATYQFNCANLGNSINKALTMKEKTLADGNQLIYVNTASAMTAFPNQQALRVFGIKVVSVPGTDPTYEVHWIRTFKSEEDMQAYAEKN